MKKAGFLPVAGSINEAEREVSSDSSGNRRGSSMAIKKSIEGGSIKCPHCSKKIDSVP